MSINLQGPGLWYVTRATGLVSLVLLTLSVLLGLLVAGRFTSERWPRFLTQGLHRNLSLLVLVFLALHIGSTVLDTYTSISLAAAFIPFASAYHPLWLSLGAVALDLLIALIVTSLVRNRLGYRAWRRLHWLVYACWPVAVAHGLGIGTDRSATWVIVLTFACMGCVAVVATWRVFTLRAQ
jgi:methionine sulfoxide reductase heme-binding subunit